jgi:hypothetical protein
MKAFHLFGHVFSRNNHRTLNFWVQAEKEPEITLDWRVVSFMVNLGFSSQTLTLVVDIFNLFTSFTNMQVKSSSKRICHHSRS